MGTYAAVADLRARSEIPDAAPPSDVELEEKIADAEDLVDRLVGARPVGALGRKWNVAPGTGLSDEAVEALKRSTVELAVVAYQDPGAFDPPAARSVSGPDFSLTEAAEVSPPAQRAIRAAAARLDAHGLRILSGRATLG